MIDTEEKKLLAEEILRKEGKSEYFLLKMQLVRNPSNKKIQERISAILEDVFDRHGQNLDGDLEFKHKDEEEVKFKGN